MRYLMQQKFFSWGQDFTIKDASGNDVFLVDGAAFSLGAQLSFNDLAGKELVHIESPAGRSACRRRLSGSRI